MTTRFRSPAWLHFCALGLLVFAVEQLLARATPAPIARAPIVVDAPRITALAVAYARQTGTPPTRAQLDGLIAADVDDDLLVAEARVASLDRDDGSVRLRLVQKMRAVSDDPTLDDAALEGAARTLGLDDDLVIRRILATKMRLVLARDDGPPPTDDELGRWLIAHRRDWELPPSLSLTQVFASARVHGDHVQRDAQSLATWLRCHDVPPALIAARSDPFILGATLRARSRADLARQLGDAFADAVMRLPVGQWSNPIASPFGWHVVRVDARQPGALPPVESVRRQLRLAVAKARAFERLQAGLARLHQLYAVRVDAAAIAPALEEAAQAPAPLASFEAAP